jgi:dephospho-CoA kinase
MNKSQQRIIGLTGGIATGKSTVSNYLANQYKIPVLDADIYARQAVEKNSPILALIFERYGEKVKLSNGNLNRQYLGEIIFNNPKEKSWLESQIHPFVYQCFVRDLKSISSPIVVLSIPLLLEAKMTDLVTEIWVVSCSFQEQINRLKKRNNLSKLQAVSRINSQLPLEQKIAQANVVLDNDKSLDSLFSQIDFALSRKLTLN